MRYLEREIHEKANGDLHRRNEQGKPLTSKTLEIRESRGKGRANEPKLQLQIGLFLSE